jgi:HK97 gp10 family phage protein
MADIEITVNVTGLDELEQTLVAGGKKAARNFLRKVERRVAQIPLEAMKQTVPVAERAYRRGDHKGGSIWIEPGTVMESLRISSQATADSLTTHVGPAKDENYVARFLNYGTDKMPATHWMDQAWQLSKDQMLDAYADITTELLNEMVTG